MKIFVAVGKVGIVSLFILVLVCSILLVVLVEIQQRGGELTLR